MARDGGGDERTALIAYGSETGTAEDVAYELGRLTRRLHFETIVTELDQIGLVSRQLPEVPLGRHG